MTVKSIHGDYPSHSADELGNFHGNQLVYVGWDHHTSYCSAHCYPLPPEMPFGALTEEVLPSVLGRHPEFGQIDWNQVEWLLDGESFTPNPALSLADNKIGHKSLLRLRTPGLEGYRDTGN